MRRPDFPGQPVPPRRPRASAPVSPDRSRRERVAPPVRRIDDDSRRFTARRRRRRTIVLMSLGTLIGVALLVTGIVMSPLFTLTTIVVKGLDVVPEKVIVGAASDQIGQPLASVNFDSIRDRLNSVPRIQSFATEIQPPHTLVIRVVERQAIGSVFTDGVWAVVDVAGVVIDTQEVKPDRIPEIAVASTTDRAFTAIAETLASLPKSTRQKISVIAAKTRDSVRFTLRGIGHQINWGSPDDSAVKRAVMERALDVANSRVGRYEIDVSAPDNIVLQPIS
jgi:cell division protein FtsQ